MSMQDERLVGWQHGIGISAIWSMCVLLVVGRRIGGRNFDLRR
jgi:hypothetical protein